MEKEGWYMKTNSIWVGNRKGDGPKGIFLFDPEIQNLDPITIFLFDSRLGQMQLFHRKNLAENFETIADKKVCDSALQQYAVWKKTQGKYFFDIHYVSEEDWIRKTSEKHKKYLAGLGKINSGVARLSSKKTIRITHCYKCKNRLDNRIDLECNNCGWIICCFCGACGCGYTADES